jgi:hypothetical protein
MKTNIEKPSPEAKALSLFLMAFKSTDPAYKDQAKHINKQWDLVKNGDLSRSDYIAEIQKVLESYGGYTEVIKKTVQFYIDKTGEWKLQGDDKYCIDAKEIAAKLSKK